MKKVLLNCFIITLILSFIVKINMAQDFSHSGLNLGLKIGSSRLLGEIPINHSGIINEFDNKFGLASAFEISKYVSPRWEICSEISYSTLKGNTFSPEFSAEGIQAGIPSEINDPVEYNNNLSGLNFFFRYFLKEADSESALIPIIRVGAGYLKYYSKFKYIDAPKDDLIFGKGTEGFTQLSTPVFFVGTGFKTPLSSKFYLVTSLDLNMVIYDFLDVMHNYGTDRNRLQVIGMYAEFKVGIFYNFSLSVRDANKQNGSRNRNSSNSSHLPFAR